ncbi:GSCFA domain-containing protein [Rhizobium sp. CNPSo 4039]|uniref:GSCFA domain-containing protein n=1 Tax=Rhizobium sp. CNPSo 4039 TaxID=3021409 RepID=UPI000DDDD10F|nr:GSCFA domain-containing protein [Rhizobium sp. CNPSo 4039]MDK4713675.1 GSCFA domain-containing protein [Rhizobium sp. CNPSo 4039]
MHPYKLQPSKARWRETVSLKHPLDIAEWYERKFQISDGGIAAGGSCFAQHIGTHLRTSGFNFIDREPAPPWMGFAETQKFGYNLYSARFGNIYSPRQLFQLLRRSMGDRSFDERPWRHGMGFVDPFRPTIEPPLSTEDEVLISRELHLQHVAAMFKNAKTFIFTLGLTETWTNRKTGAAYPVCPGVSGGSYDSDIHKLQNFDFTDVVADLEKFISEFKSVRKDGQIIFTVSPVPLVATATQNNVVVATTYSKSVLRAAAGHLAERHPFVDYFPSYEIISSTPMKSMFFEPDMRSVNKNGVSHVMSHFFSQHQPTKPAAEQKPSEMKETVTRTDLICDEMLLELAENSKV